MCAVDAGICTLLNQEFICACKQGYNGDGYSCIGMIYSINSLHIF